MKRLPASLRPTAGLPRLALGLFLTLALLLATSALVELRQSRRELRALMETQAHTLLESLLAASENALDATDRLEALAGDAEDAADARTAVGFGPLLRRVAEHPGIRYVALQDTSGVLAAAGEAALLEPLDDSPLLLEAWLDTTLATRSRMRRDASPELFEVVHPFYRDGLPAGVFRLGLSTEPLRALDARMHRRLLLLSLLLLSVGFVGATLLVLRQQARLLERRVRAVETYSSRVLEHVGDGILVFNETEGVRSINRAAEQLLGVQAAAAPGQPPEALLPGPECRRFLDSPAVQETVSCLLGGRARRLLLTRTTFEDARGARNTILILRDRTRQDALEAEVLRRERLAAVGEVAPVLAHEIRNPLGTIGTIVQQLRKDFRPEGPLAAEYDELTGLVHDEVRRIRDAVQRFLQAARPAPVRAAPFELSALLRGVVHRHAALAETRGATLTLRERWSGPVHWDADQMRDALDNLVRNALEAVPPGGRVELSAEAPDPDHVLLSVSDDGPGIPEEIRPRIFDLFFTTKPGGTGIGLGIVQRIVQEHGGTITVEPAGARGVRFALRLPAWVARPRATAAT